jgi:hypothetical protein
VAEGARLESVYTGNRIVGSNPTPSAKLFSGDVHGSSGAFPGGPNLQWLLAISVYNPAQLLGHLLGQRILALWHVKSTG